MMDESWRLCTGPYCTEMRAKVEKADRRVAELLEDLWILADYTDALIQHAADLSEVSDYSSASETVKHKHSQNVDRMNSAESAAKERKNIADMVSEQWE